MELIVFFFLSIAERVERVSVERTFRALKVFSFRLKLNWIVFRIFLFCKCRRRFIFTYDSSVLEKTESSDIGR